MSPSTAAQKSIAVLEANHLAKRYGALPAVQDISLRLNPGEVLGCVGPNGAGKSTTVKMLIGLLKPTTGEVWFEGREINQDLVGYRKSIGYVVRVGSFLEYVAILDPIRVILLAFLLGGWCFALRSYRSDILDMDRAVIFEESPNEAVQVLGLHTTR